MSWSFSAIGKPSAVLAKAKKDLGSHKCMEPEETIKGHFLDALASALAAMPGVSAVKVAAGGSQSSYSNNPGLYNSLKIEIEPIWQFVE